MDFKFISQAITKMQLCVEIQFLVLVVKNFFRTAMCLHSLHRFNHVICWVGIQLKRIFKCILPVIWKLLYSDFYGLLHRNVNVFLLNFSKDSFVPCSNI